MRYNDYINWIFFFYIGKLKINSRDETTLKTISSSLYDSICMDSRQQGGDGIQLQVYIII